MKLLPSRLKMAFFRYRDVLALGIDDPRLEDIVRSEPRIGTVVFQLWHAATCVEREALPPLLLSYHAALGYKLTLQEQQLVRKLVDEARSVDSIDGLKNWVLSKIQEAGAKSLGPEDCAWLTGNLDSVDRDPTD